ncbi:hypothetical protein SHELI_v1c08850 [Spiroplasma helicoides]|uniref:ABC transporter permease n=1 Tax=Spiroplasma helicoides TaxID=216938 RepID=A0A1B3SLN1_9MOLU|nr:hypothetical protein [Spiroplasma helicoides]AOG60834.1 hypothetical protein SHELI_v1c08850 [Spiroplasma helicoides]
MFKKQKFNFLYLVFFQIKKYWLLFLVTTFFACLTIVSALSMSIDEQDAYDFVYHNVLTTNMIITFVMMSVQSYYLFFKNLKRKKYQIFLLTHMTKSSLFFTNYFVLALMNLVHLILNIIICSIYVNINFFGDVVDLGKIIIELIIIWFIVFSLTILGICFLYLLAEVYNHHIFWYIVIVFAFCILHQVLLRQLQSKKLNSVSWFSYLSPYGILNIDDLKTWSIRLIIPIIISITSLVGTTFFAKYLNSKLNY